MNRILIVSSNVGSLYNQRLELLNELVKTKKIYFICNNEDEEKKLLYFKQIGMKYINIRINRRSKNIFFELVTFISYLIYIIRLKPNIVLTYTMKPNIYIGIICRLYKIKCIPTITGLGTAFQKNNILRKIIIFLSRLSFRNAYIVFFQNRENLDLFLSLGIVKREKIKLVNGSGVNLEKFKKTFIAKKDRIVFIFIGRIMKEKGIDEYLEVAKRLKQKYKKIEFYILGSFEEKRYCEIIRSLEKEHIVEYLGISGDIREYLKEVHCLVNPSWHEGMSNVLLEAGAMGKFLIASDIPGCREIVLNNITGYTFNKKNILDLQLKIEKFINLSNQEYREYVKKLYQHIKNNFNRKEIIKQYIEEIENILAKGGWDQ